MSKCLSNMHLAMLAAGEGSLALRKSLSEHLLECTLCREILVAVIKSDMQVSSSLDTARDRAEVTVERDADLIDRIVDRVSNSVVSTVGRIPDRCVIPLKFHQTEKLMLAANEATDIQTEPVATCSSEDEKYTVTFFRADEGDGLKATVKRRNESDQKPVNLTFPGLDLAFPLDDDGMTGTMDIEGILLRLCRVDVEV